MLIVLVGRYSRLKEVYGPANGFALGWLILEAFSEQLLFQSGLTL